LVATLHKESKRLKRRHGVVEKKGSVKKRRKDRENNLGRRSG
jgi:hypothetical protein